jgi:cytoskeletal protein CcmA (bactofilin family)
MPKEEEGEKKDRPAEHLPERSSLFGPTLSFTGDIIGEEDLVIRGKLKGQLSMKYHSLVIDQGALIEGDIHTKDITIGGEVKGNVFASGKVLITSTGKMAGDISASKISIMDGAQFKGSIKTETSPLQKPLWEKA